MKMKHGSLQQMSMVRRNEKKINCEEKFVEKIGISNIKVKSYFLQKY